MSGNAPENPSTPVPAEVPDEFADAYRLAYEQALAAQAEVAPHRSAVSYDEADESGPGRLPRRVAPLRVGTHRTPASPKPRSQPSSESSPKPSSSTLLPTTSPTTGAPTTRAPRKLAPPPERAARHSVLPAPSSRSGADPDEDPTAYERVRDSRWFVPVLLLLLAVLLVLGAYVVGRAFADSVGTDAGGAVHPLAVTAPGAA